MTVRQRRRFGKLINASTKTYLVLLLCASLQGPFAQAGFAAPIRVAITSHSLSFVIPILAQQKGLYRDEGLEVEVVQARSQVTVIALTSGDIDYTASLGTAFRAALNGFPFRVVSVSASAPVQQLVAHSSANTLSDLRGKILGVEQAGGTSWYLPRKVFKQVGLVDHARQVRQVFYIPRCAGNFFAGIYSGFINPFLRTSGAILHPLSSILGFPCARLSNGL